MVIVIKDLAGNPFSRQMVWPDGSVSTKRCFSTFRLERFTITLHLCYKVVVFVSVSKLKVT